MANAWPAVVGTLGGALIGAAASYATSARQWRRQRRARWDEIRREVYGRFLAKSSACHASLCRVAWRIDPKRERRQEEIDSRWREANELRSDVIALRGQLDILATDAARQAAAAIVERLDALNSELYSHDRNKTTPQSEKEYNATYGTLRDDFVQTIRAELKV